MTTYSWETLSELSGKKITIQHKTGSLFIYIYVGTGLAPVLNLFNNSTEFPAEPLAFKNLIKYNMERR